MSGEMAKNNQDFLTNEVNESKNTSDSIRQETYRILEESKSILKNSKSDNFKKEYEDVRLATIRALRENDPRKQAKAELESFRNELSGEGSETLSDGEISSEELEDIKNEFYELENFKKNKKHINILRQELPQQSSMPNKGNDAFDKIEIKTENNNPQKFLRENLKNFLGTNEITKENIIKGIQNFEGKDYIKNLIREIDNITKGKCIFLPELMGDTNFIYSELSNRYIELQGINMDSSINNLLSGLKEKEKEKVGEQIKKEIKNLKCAGASIKEIQKILKENGLKVNFNNKDDIVQILQLNLENQKTHNNQEIKETLENNNLSLNEIQKLESKKELNKLLDKNNVSNKDKEKILKYFANHERFGITNGNIKSYSIQNEKEFNETNEKLENAKNNEDIQKEIINMNKRIDHRFETNQKQLGFELRKIFENNGFKKEPPDLLNEYRTDPEVFKDYYEMQFENEEDFKEAIEILERLSYLKDQRKKLSNNLKEIESYKKQYGSLNGKSNLNIIENEQQETEIKNNIYSYSSETGGVKIETKFGKEEIQLNKQEQNLVKNNPDILENIVDFYKVLEEVGLNKLWNIKEKIFNAIGNKKGIGFKIDENYLSENETIIFLNSILKSVGEKELSSSVGLDDIKSRIEIINNVQIGGTEKVENFYFGETKIENKFFEKYTQRNGNLIGFKQSEFENNI